ncbi:hypothetical protein EIN_057270 [Entamoeba invadens IP1]|uniref:hypothetical protein n=1 Tax=Entamoeba invadens IP1 TaxID=370355 RepID=UPI0002C3F646|nr:hypothetical protein EIN_057270 [Entamoeba invadens IP1]ELP93342.1 hypothetical protein EIN_057270 [Entamoeba invadens IP1]|eukprot:XP_004260113.1 hypothetical protein EIN_057270 [Entamoeba invadens IP1]
MEKPKPADQLSKNKTQLTDPETLRNRKRMSRNGESVVTNSVLYVLVNKVNAQISFRKTKKTKQTIKMLLPENVVIDNVVYDQNSIAKLNEKFLDEVMSEKALSVEGMNDKQYTRTREAQICNGLLYLLRASGFTFSVKQTKKAKLTEKLVKISSITMPNGNILTMEKLTEIGTAFQQAVDDRFGRDQTVVITNSVLKKYNIPPLDTPNIPTGDSLLMQVISPDKEFDKPKRSWTNPFTISADDENNFFQMKSE